MTITAESTTIRDEYNRVLDQLRYVAAEGIDGLQFRIARLRNMLETDSDPIVEIAEPPTSKEAG